MAQTSRNQSNDSRIEPAVQLNPALATLRPLLEECGYTGSHLKEGYPFGSMTIPLVGFAAKPWDFDSACIAVLMADGDSETAARSCRGMGAPIVWVPHNGTVDWWMQHHDASPTLFASESMQDFSALVQKHRTELGPLSVYRGKTIARVDPARQLDFVDAGLLPLLRGEAGKKLGDVVEEMTRAMLKVLGECEPGKGAIRTVFVAVFRLLAGKILKDKEVEGFAGFDLTDPEGLLSAVEKHYNNPGPRKISMTRAWKAALAAAALPLGKASNFSVVSPETLAYVYEHTLVTKALRKQLGIHATPPWLVDYIVWRLSDWIREIPEGDRHVFEPACGHSPFLLAAMRLLRLEIEGRSEAAVHEYLKAHIHGLEIDDFAQEIARLSLTLADIPNPNGWDLRDGDMYASNVLAQEAAECGIFLSNPPYEKFSEEEKLECDRAGYPVAQKKAVELLLRTLNCLRPGSVFGVVVPQAVVSGAEAKAVREVLLEEFEIAEVCLFPGKVFEFAQAETAVILGRRRRAGQNVGSHSVRLRQIGEHGMADFQRDYSFTWSAEASQRHLARNKGLELWVPALDEVWQVLDRNRRLHAVATIGRGIEFKNEEARKRVLVVVPRTRDGYATGYEGGYARVSVDQAIFGTPPEEGIATSLELIENPRQGMRDGVAKVLVNRTRTARGPWRIKALLDPDGKPVKNNFLTVRPTEPNISAIFLWAVLNSPVANAFIASRTMKRDNADGALADVPLPRIDATGVQTVAKLAEAYRSIAERRASAVAEQKGVLRSPLFVEAPDAPPGPADSEVRAALLALDAAIMRLYNLKPRLERQLLDYFAEHERRGVGCDFQGYYPAGFTSFLPLHMLISDRFRQAAADATADRFKPGESAYVRDVLSIAAAGVEGE